MRLSRTLLNDIIPKRHPIDAGHSQLRPQMLTLIFQPTGGGAPVHSRALYFRLCADGTVRGSDNAIAAVCADNRWRVGQRWFRELECTGPVWLRCRDGQDSAAVLTGPYKHIRTVDGHLFADDLSLGMNIPGWHYDAAESCHELSLLSSLPRTLPVIDEPYR